MPTYTMTGPTTLQVTFTPDEAAIVARAQQEGVEQFKTAFDAVIAKYRDKYDAEDKTRLVNLFGSADRAIKRQIFTLLEG